MVSRRRKSSRRLGGKKSRIAAPDANQVALLARPLRPGRSRRPERSSDTGRISVLGSRRRKKKCGDGFGRETRSAAFKLSSITHHALLLDCKTPGSGVTGIGGAAAPMTKLRVLAGCRAAGGGVQLTAANGKAADGMARRSGAGRGQRRWRASALRALPRQEAPLS